MESLLSKAQYKQESELIKQTFNDYVEVIEKLKVKRYSNYTNDVLSTPLINQEIEYATALHGYFLGEVLEDELEIVRNNYIEYLDLSYELDLLNAEIRFPDFAQFTQFETVVKLLDRGRNDGEMDELEYANRIYEDTEEVKRIIDQARYKFIGLGEKSHEQQITLLNKQFDYVKSLSKWFESPTDTNLNIFLEFREDLFSYRDKVAEEADSVLSFLNDFEIGNDSHFKEKGKLYEGTD